MLLLKHELLVLYFRAQLFFAWKAKLVLRCKQLLVIVQDRVLGDCFARLGTQNNAQRWVVILPSLQIVVHAHIHVHLANVLVGNLACFEVNQYETLQNVVVEH